ncbi:MAG: glycosyltransferase family 2 protein [bacterium]
MEKKIFCVIPAYNEEKNISQVIVLVRPLVNKVVVVDDCSSDQTYESAKKQNVVVLRHIINRGQGAALQTGDEYALRHGADIIVHFDADGQFIAEEIKDLVRPIAEEDYNAVFGSRFLGRKSNMPWFKKNIIMPVARLVNRIIIGSKFTDPQCGFRAFSRLAAKNIKIDQDRMAHASEILFKTNKNKLKIKEVPVTVIYKEFGQNFRGGAKIIKDLFFGKIIQ